MIDNIIISIESAIHESPVMRDNFTWNEPKPVEFTAWSTVNVSGYTKKNNKGMGYFF